MRDDPIQTAIADEVLRIGAFVPLTVFLETAWLFRSRYRLDRIQLVKALQAIVDMPQVVIDGGDAVRWALGQVAQGGDIADLLHVVAARGASAFMTFDRDIAQYAGPDSPIPIETLA